MGGFITNKVDPSYNSQNKSLMKLYRSPFICRKNFKFIKKVFTNGFEDEAITWLAHNIDDSTQKFFVKAINKKLIFKHRRIDCVLNELRILKNRRNNNFIIQPLYAFQDYSTLYLVTEFVDGFTLEEVLKEHVFTEEQAKYVVTSLISIIECIHQQKLALTELNPKNIIVEKGTGRLKLLQASQAMQIDGFYPSQIISPMSQYSAPQILAMDQVLAESDYYSLGLILYYIMKGKPAIPPEIRQNRMAILVEKILVLQSDLPEGFKPDAADFLVKILIKNPELRLGRYGSFQISNHPWLQNYSWSINNDFQGINLSQSYFLQQNNSHNTKPTQSNKNLNEQLDTSFQFQRLFREYQYCSSVSEQSLSYDSIQEQY